MSRILIFFLGYFDDILHSRVEKLIVVEDRGGGDREDEEVSGGVDWVDVRVVSDIDGDHGDEGGVSGERKR